MLPQLERAYLEGGSEAFEEAGADGAFDSINERALTYARIRAAELVGMRWKGHRLAPNPNAKYAITETTRLAIRAILAKAFRDGLSPDEVEAAVARHVNDPLRAETIAEQELSTAQQSGSIAGWRASGVVDGKRALLSNDHPEPDHCDDNAEAGVIGLDERFPSGHDTSPFHVRCYCDVAAVVN